ncbi:hypothetical protein DPMN_051411 [Dreissena polymorpha]|uniref:Uncharacterized protein n=1 Tax=Dreissena polymorpha TaxID=45954 RepID=A0A9D4CIY2_DREPO|nr:hypothetical protein DPMN_051411 [Dreissena polymorpha]
MTLSQQLISEPSTVDQQTETSDSTRVKPKEHNEKTIKTYHSKVSLNSRTNHELKNRLLVWTIYVKHVPTN